MRKGTDNIDVGAGNILMNKQNRSFIVLAISVLFILGINAALPVIEGSAHYTAEAIEVTYGEYSTRKASNSNYRLSWASEQKINKYILEYIESYPDLTEVERLEVEVPDNFKVNMYTKFFFESPVWYLSTTTSVMSAVILFYSIFNYLITKAKDKYVKYVEMEQQVEVMVKNHLDPVTFEPWMDEVFNPKRKINQHRKNTKYELDVLEKRASYKTKRRFREYFKAFKDTPIDLPEIKWWQFATRHYVNKKEKLISLLDDDYIDEYVVDGKVKYFKHIYPPYVYNGTDSTSKSTDNYSQVQTDAERVSSDALKKVLTSIMITTLITILFTVTAVTSFEQQPLWIIFNVGSKLAPLALQLPLSFDYSNAFMKTQLMGNMQNRRTISLLYLADMKKEVSDNMKDGDTHA